MHPTHPFIDSVALSIGPVAIHWYGLMYLFGFTAFWLLGWVRSRQANALINVDQLTDLLFFGVAGVILGGRIGYVLFYQPGSLLQDPLLLVRLWEGGMSFHGGLLGVVLACVFFARSRQIPFLKLTDFVAPLIPLGLGFGRIGNWINGELWGRPTDLPWAMIFPMIDQLPRHPSQLYQATLEGLMLFILLWWFSVRPRPIGAVSGVFLLAYGLFRFVVEFVREPDLHLGYLALGWLTMGQLLSLPMMLAGGLLLYTAYRRL